MAGQAQRGPALTVAAATVLSRVERAKAAVRETAARLADELAKPKQDRARIQRLQASLAFAQGDVEAAGRRAVRELEG